VELEMQMVEVQVVVALAQPELQPRLVQVELENQQQ
jgi:hypothetical protein